MLRQALALGLVLQACNDDSDTFEGGISDVASPENAKACTEFCPAPHGSVVIDTRCADASVVDAMFGGSCADASATCGVQDPSIIPFRDCQQVLVFPLSVGTCTVTLQFADDASYASQTFVTQGPGDECCNGMFTSSPPVLSVSDASCE